MPHDQTLLAGALGILEGLTEFLPISSTGHLIVFAQWFAFDDPSNTFKITIQLGAILAVVVAYRQRLWQTACGLSSDARSRHFFLALVVGTLPALLAGALLYSTIKTLFAQSIVGWMLIIGGIVMLIVDRRPQNPRYQSAEAIPLSTAFAIGIFQTLAMIPGTSRSGATIVGGLLFGVERKAAAEFSFFLAIPTMTAATIYEVWQQWEHLSFSAGGNIALGFFLAFVTALMIVRLFVVIVGKVGFFPFALYRIAFGILVLAVLA